MTEQDQIRIAHELLDAFNSNNWEKYKQYMTQNAVYNEVGSQRRIEGIGQIIETFQGWKQAMPDAKGRVSNIFAGNNYVTIEVTWTGTHTGPLTTPTGTIPASGNSHTTPGAWILHFEGDTVIESRNYFDMVTLLTQIGAMPK
jgi:steroid delta-isomerase-like uncharacterized protein